MRFIVSLAVREEHGAAQIWQFAVNGNTPDEAYKAAIDYCDSQGLQWATETMIRTRVAMDTPIRGPVVLLDGSERTF